jgi:hypothetical protein
MSLTTTSSVTLPVSMSTTVVGSNNMTDTITISSGGTYGTIAMGVITDDLLDKYEFNKLTVDHKVSAHELLKLKDTVPTYADEIKENLAKNASRELVKKMTFTKKHDVDSDVHHFIGRVWVFTEEELKKFIEEVKNA